MLGAKQRYPSGFCAAVTKVELRQQIYNVSRSGFTVLEMLFDANDAKIFRERMHALPSAFHFTSPIIVGSVWQSPIDLARRKDTVA